TMPIQSLLKPATVSQSDFFEWNPALSLTATVIPAGYRVKVPPEKAARFSLLQQRALDTPAKKKSIAMAARKDVKSANGKAAARNKNARSTSLEATRSQGGRSAGKATKSVQGLKTASR